ncbi:MAG: hypothetical protein RSH23_04235, partial [Erysipelotrichaceae bacterium]
EAPTSMRYHSHKWWEYVTFIFSNQKHTTLDSIKNKIRLIIPFSSILVFIIATCLVFLGLSILV